MSLLVLVLHRAALLVAIGWANLTINRFRDGYAKRYGGILTTDEARQRSFTDPFSMFTGARDAVAGFLALRRPVHDPEVEALRHRARRAIALAFAWLFFGRLPIAAVVSALGLPTELDPGVAASLAPYVPALVIFGVMAGWIVYLVYWRWRWRTAPMRWWVVPTLEVVLFGAVMLWVLTSPRV